MLLLRRFNNKGKPLAKPLREDLEKHFKYFWLNNRTSTLLEKKDYFDALPRDIKRRLMTEYLYEDIFKEKYFQNLFDNGEAMDPDFLYDISFGFQPRQFWGANQDDRRIIESDEYVTEMYLIQSGKFVIAKKVLKHDEGMKEAKHANEVEEDVIIEVKGKKYLVLKTYNKPTYIGEYYIFTSTKSNYDYIALEDVNTFALT